MNRNVLNTKRNTVRYRKYGFDFSTIKNAKMAVGFWNSGSLSHTIGDFQTQKTAISFLSEHTATIKTQCGLNELGSFFDYFAKTTDRPTGTETVSVDVVTIGNAVINSLESLDAMRYTYQNLTHAQCYCRPESDVTLVVIPDRRNWQLNEQAAVIGCGDTWCENVLSISEGITNTDLSERIHKDSCMRRIFQSTISCSEYAMKVVIPSCALKGVEIWEIGLKENILCNVKMDFNSTYYSWEIDYNDCGTSKTVDGKVTTYRKG